MLPLTQRVEIDEDVYLQYVGRIAEIKLRRYNAYAKVVARSVVFQDGTRGAGTPTVEQALKDYALRLNIVSASIHR